MFKTFEQFSHQPTPKGEASPNQEPKQRSATEVTSVIASVGLSVLTQIRVWHWQTTVGDFHKALGDFYGSFSDLNDHLIEVCMGKYGRVKCVEMTAFTSPVDFTPENFNVGISAVESNYNTVFRAPFQDKDPEICNIIDEIVGEIQKLKYLSTLS